MGMVEQIRSGIAVTIRDNAHEIVTMVRPTRENAYGKEVPDIDAVAVRVVLGIAAILRRRRPEPQKANAMTPYDYLDVYYLLADHTAVDWLKEGIVFQFHDLVYRTLKPEVKYKRGLVTHIVADLEEVTTRDVEDVS